VLQKQASAVQEMQRTLDEEMAARAKRRIEEEAAQRAWEGA